MSILYSLILSLAAGKTTSCSVFLHLVFTCNIVIYVQSIFCYPSTRLPIPSITDYPLETEQKSYVYDMRLLTMPLMIV